MGFNALQWGRDVSIPEIRDRDAGEGADHGGFNGAGMFPSQKYNAPRVRRLIRVASMGPGCFHPRNIVEDEAAIMGLVASMGPGCFHPRNVAERNTAFAQYARFNGAGMFPSQKYIGDWHSITQVVVLQWGRDVSIPEMPPPPLNCMQKPRFNGAGMFPSQKWRDAAGVRGHPIASMGPGCFHPRNRPGRWTRNDAWSCFNGAGMFPSQKCGCLRNGGIHVLLASMGPGCFHPRNPPR